jgi:hypothetical protein
MRAWEARSRFATLELRDIISTATAGDVVGFTRRPRLPAPGDEVEVNTRRLDVVRTVVAPAGDTGRSRRRTRRSSLTDVDRSRRHRPDLPVRTQRPCPRVAQGHDRGEARRMK